nr:restriction endonuclease subunit S [Serpentinimonas maccroryi]
MRSGWQHVRLGDVVENVNSFFTDRSGEAIRYVAGEHIDEGDLKVRRCGLTSDEIIPPTFNRLFKAGDVLFHSRNIRKLAQPDFDGLTGEKLFVLRTKDQSKLSQALLPFLLQTMNFRNYVEERWAGSTNKFLNKTPLMAYEFALPPVEEQHRLVKLLTSIEGCLASLAEADLATTALENSRIEDALALVPADRVITVDKLVPLGPKNGLSPKANADERGYPTLSIGAVRDGRIVAEGNTKYAEISDAEAAAFELKANDVLVVRGNGNKLLTGRCGLVDVVPKGCFYPDLLIRLKFDEKIIRPEFAVLQWNSQSTHNRLISRAKSTNGIWKINGADIRQHALKVPEVEEQDDLLAEMRAIRSARKNIATRMTAAQNLKLHALRSIENGGGNGI